MNTRAVAFGSVLLLVASGIAACSGGGSGSAVSPVATPAPVTGPTNSPMSGSTGTLTLTIPRSTSASQRSPRFVSPNSAVLRTTVKTVNGQPPTATQVPVNPTTTLLSTGAGGNCTASPAGETCTVTIPAPSGSVVYQFDLLDAATPPHVLATITVTLTIAPGSTNPNLQATLDGVVASVTITAPHLQPGTAFSGPITVQAFDASGALITGSAPFALSFTLTDNDGTTHTSLTDGGTTGKTITDGSPNDVVILNYDGANIPSFSISFTLSGGSRHEHGRQRASRHQPDADPGPDDHADEHADGDSDAHAHAHAHARRSDADADPHADGNAHRDADSHADADADADSHADADSNAVADSGSGHAQRRSEPAQRQRHRRDQRQDDHGVREPVSGAAPVHRVRHVQPGRRHDRDRHDEQPAGAVGDLHRDRRRGRKLRRDLQGRVEPNSRRPHRRHHQRLQHQQPRAPMIATTQPTLLAGANLHA